MPQVATTHTQTTWFRKVNAATQYESIEMNDKLRTIAQRSSQLCEFLASAVDGEIGLTLRQNEAIDIFRADFPPQVEEETMFGGKVYFSPSPCFVSFLFLPFKSLPLFPIRPTIS